jgi:GINS complex subunit 2
MSRPWLPEELNFLAEEEALIRILPRFNAPKTAFMAQEFGPFQPGRSTKVPLWLALFLNSSDSCNLVPPKWLNLSSLRKVLERERREKDVLTAIPPHYLEVSTAFFARDTSGIRDVDQVKTTVEELWLTRNEKIRRSIAEATSASLDYFELPNATRMELHLYREPITRIRHILTTLNGMEATGEETEEGHSQVPWSQ